jgi:hypothetical protein
MGKLNFLIILFTLMIFLSKIAIADDWLTNYYFDNPSYVFDTGTKINAFISESPDNWKWGYSCYNWDNSGASYPLSSCRVNSYYAGSSDYNVQLEGTNSVLGKTGVVKLVQGNVWGGSVPWYTPPIASITHGNYYIDAWYNVKSTSGPLSNLMFDVWLKDTSTGRIMVLDLMFYTWWTRDPWWDGSVFHYQAYVCGTGLGSWYHCNLNLNGYIDSAIYAAKSQGINFDRRSTYIYQTEILNELFTGGSASMDVGSFRLNWQPCSASGEECGTGCCSGLVCLTAYPNRKYCSVPPSGSGSCAGSRGPGCIMMHVGPIQLLITIVFVFGAFSLAMFTCLMILANIDDMKKHLER